MLDSLKKFLKVYPLPIFVLLLTFVIYYSAFELLREKKSNVVVPQTEADSMLDNSNQTAMNTIKPTELEPDLPNETQSTIIEIPQEPQDELIQIPKTYISTDTKSLNIRQEPNTTSAIIGKLTPADQTILLEEKGDWIFIADVESERPLGWIMKRFSKEITPSSPSSTQTIESRELPTAPITLHQTYITSNVRSLNIRQEPNTTSAIIGKLTPSHKAVILEERGEWILIGTFEDSKVLGWILKSLSQEIPQEITISETKNFTPANTSQLSRATQTNTESLTQDEKPTTKTALPGDSIQSTQDAPLYTSRVPSLNIRQLPSTDTPVIGKLTPNDSVIIVETQDIWVRILDANTPSIKNGWVVRRSLTLRQ
ncbi:SH3 domain-containing protein [uncultured Helicobacter sp.]|uniref:SH3 domain-containing protein n=1 Tax=uncultured Helicobacter sp. TaxID=175537 RepID=UPI00261CE141|nr:SH3 domain-containing protein [uncultured Helicobacter sp.]